MKQKFDLRGKFMIYKEEECYRCRGTGRTREINKYGHQFIRVCSLCCGSKKIQVSYMKTLFSQAITQALLKTSSFN